MVSYTRLRSVKMMALKTSQSKSQTVKCYAVLQRRNVTQQRNSILPQNSSLSCFLIIPQIHQLRQLRIGKSGLAGVVRRGILKLTVKQGLDTLANGLVNGFTGTVQLILSGNTGLIVAGWIPEELKDAIADEVENRLLMDASGFAKAVATGSSGACRGASCLLVIL